MAIKYECDLCKGIIPIKENMTDIFFGDEKIAEVCYNCKSALKTSIMEQKTKALTADKEPSAPKEAPKVAEAKAVETKAEAS